MTVEDFNTIKGLYIFRFDNIDTSFHSHPAIEIIIAEKGTFTLCIDSTEFQRLKFAVIEANKKHKLSSTDCDLTIIMVEHHNKFIIDKFISNGIHIDIGLHLQAIQQNARDITNDIIQNLKDDELPMEYDERIAAVIKNLDNNDLEYGLMTKTLQRITNLSESRLSHLFKHNTGISVKKYLIWTRLKSTIKQHLKNQEDLFGSLLKSGFYDQPHFTRNFKAMLGVKPSKAYNSRMLQVSMTLPR
jgi:AraC-like DNA-binding protein